MPSRSDRPPRRVIWRLSDLTRLELCVLRHVERYRLTTRAGWRGAWEFREFDQGRVARTVRRLVAMGVLKKRILFGSTHAFELDVLGAKLLQLPGERSRELSPPATVRAYAQLLFATTGLRRWIIFNSSHSEKWYPNQVDFPAAGLFFDPRQLNVFVHLTIDRQFSTSVSRVTKRIIRMSNRLMKLPQWREKMTDGTLLFAAITPSRRRAALIVSRFQRQPPTSGVRLTVMVAPGLIPLAGGN